MTTIAACAGGPDDLAAGTRRTEAANQRDAWLRQMELAQLAGMAGTPVHAAPAAAPFARVPGATLAPSAAQVAAPSAVPPRHPAVGAGNIAGPAHGMPGSQHDAADAAARPDDAAGNAAAGVPGEAARVPAAPADADRPADLAAEAVVARPSGPLPRPAAADAVAALPATVQMLPQSAGQAAVAAVAAAADAPPPAAPPVAIAPLPGATAPLRANWPAAPATDAEPEAAAPHALPEAGTVPEWQKRVMHLTGDGDDVRLWIRDGELSPAQTQQLVARLAGDVAAMGLRLTQATVNGKPTLRAPRADRTPSAPAAEASVQPITHPTTER